MREIFGLALSLCLALPSVVGAEEFKPSLDLGPNAAASTMTTVTELTGAPLIEPSATASPLKRTEKTTTLTQKNAEPNPVKASPRIDLKPDSAEKSLAPLSEDTPVRSQFRINPESPKKQQTIEPELRLQKYELPVKSKTVAPAQAAATKPLKLKISPAPTTTRPVVVQEPIVKPAPDPVAIQTPPLQAKPVLATPLPLQSSTSPKQKPARKPFKLNLDVGQNLQNLRNLMQGSDQVKPTSFEPLPGIAVFAVMKHGNERGFGDLPLMFAREYANRLSERLPQTRIYNPIYAVDELKMQGLGHVYDQIMSYYLKAGVPEPTATAYLLTQMSANRPTISRLVFVEADVDFNHPEASTNLLDRTKQWMTDDIPKQTKVFVVTHLQIFDAEKPDFPIIWSGRWQRSVPNSQFYNVTPSVFADSDSKQAFSRVSRQMSLESLAVTPKAAYMAPQFDTAVTGKIVPEKPVAP
jgi:hypothetical protein